MLSLLRLPEHPRAAATIFLTSNGQAKILDFGLVKSVRDSTITSDSGLPADGVTWRVGERGERAHGRGDYAI